MSSAIDNIMKRQKQFQQEQGAKGGGQDFWQKDGDITRLHFLGDSEKYITIYTAHAIKVEGQYDKLVYCPLTSFHDENAAKYRCQYCEIGEEAYPLKMRIIMWLWIHENLRQDSGSLTEQEKQLPIIERGGNSYRKRTFERPMLWEVSGWHTFSPIADFNILREQLDGDLTKRMMEMRQVGKGLDMKRRFDIVIDSEPLPAEHAQAVADLSGVQSVLFLRLTSAGESGGSVSKPPSTNVTSLRAAAANPGTVVAPHTPSYVQGDQPQASPAQAKLDQQELARQERAVREAQYGTEISGETMEPNLPPADDPEGFEPKQYQFDPDDPFGANTKAAKG